MCFLVKKFGKTYEFKNMKTAEQFARCINGEMVGMRKYRARKF